MSSQLLWAMYVQPHNYIEKWVWSASIHMVCVWSVTVLQSKCARYTTQVVWIWYLWLFGLP